MSRTVSKHLLQRVSDDEDHDDDNNDGDDCVL